MSTGLGRTALGIVLGYTLNGILVALTEPLLTKQIAGVAYFVADIAIQCVIEVAAGYLCSRIARPFGRDATVGLVILGLLIGTFSLASSWVQEPHWYGITLLAVWSPCVWLGYRLQLWRQQ
jgi:hypothetical protein